MRLAAQLKGGFYPAPPPAIDAIMDRISPPWSEYPNILDPCAGEGDAIKQIAGILGTPADHVWAIELDELRAQALRHAMPDAHVCGPASFFGASITYGSFGFALVNPPFDDEIGGGRRVESEFLERATNLLAPRGILAFICPERVASEWAIRAHLATWYEDCTLTRFPECCRKYNEVAILAKRRESPSLAHDCDYNSIRRPLPYRPEGIAGQYHIPKTDGPKRFENTELTDKELAAALAASPLRQRLLTAPSYKPASPLLPLSQGHIAILLASGHLDGIVVPPGERPHVVRGTARKVSFVVSEETSDTPGGGTKTVTKTSQKIQLIVRAVGQDGEIKTFEQQ